MNMKMGNKFLGFLNIFLLSNHLYHSFIKTRTSTCMQYAPIPYHFQQETAVEIFMTSICLYLQQYLVECVISRVTVIHIQSIAVF